MVLQRLSTVAQLLRTPALSRALTGGERTLAGPAARALSTRAGEKAGGAMTASDHVAMGDKYGAHNYHPLNVVIREAENSAVKTVDDRRLIDFLSAYSAMNFGHRHPELVKVAKEQLDRVTLTSRAFHNDQLGPFVKSLTQLTGLDRAIPMNTGAEAVETAIKAARKWAYEKKGVPDERAKIIVADGCFHGRTTTAISLSTDPQARKHFGPYTPGFESVPFGDAEALARAIDDDTAAFLVEPVQGEAGVIIPPDGYLAKVRELCTERGVLFMADEIQSGLGRTGKTFAVDHDGVKPDVMILGKALAGGIVPASAVVSKDEVLGLFKPGDHGSTFGGNPLACAVGRKVIEMLGTGEYQARSAELGAYAKERLERADLKGVAAIRGRGLWLGIDLHPERGPGREVCEALERRGLLCKDTHGSTIRLAPPLSITKAELDEALDILERVLG